MTLTRIAGSKQWVDFGGQPNVLPKCPFLFVVPPALLDQVTLECNRFLDHGSFDVIKYFAGYKSHQAVWDATEAHAHSTEHMRIYVATTTVSSRILR